MAVSTRVSFTVAANFQLHFWGLWFEVWNGVPLVQTHTDTYTRSLKRDHLDALLTSPPPFSPLGDPGRVQGQSLPAGVSYFTLSPDNKGHHSDSTHPNTEIGRAHV